MSALEKEWRLYRDACYADGPISAVQATETRQAFYAGCLVMLHLVLQRSRLPEDEANREIGKLMAETRAVCRERMKQMKDRN